MADYNLCLDKINTGTDTKDVEAEYRTLKASNETEQMKLESVFAERTQVEQQVQTLEREIEKVGDCFYLITIAIIPGSKRCCVSVWSNGKERQEKAPNCLYHRIDVILFVSRKISFNLCN